MVLSEARKKANAKYDKLHREVLACKVNKDVAIRFKEICRSQGTTANAVLAKYVIEFNKEHEARE